MSTECKIVLCFNYTGWDTEAALSVWIDTEIRGIIPESLDLGEFPVTVKREATRGSVFSNEAAYTVTELYHQSALAENTFVELELVESPPETVQASLPIRPETGGRLETFNRTAIGFTAQSIAKEATKGTEGTEATDGKTGTEGKDATEGKKSLELGVESSELIKQSGDKKDFTVNAGTSGVQGFSTSTLSLAPRGIYITISPETLDVKEKETRQKALVLAKFKPIGTAARFGPDDVVLLKPAIIKLPYNPKLIPAGKTEQELAIGFWAAKESKWVALPSVVEKAGKNTRRLVAKTKKMGVYQAMLTGVLPGGALALGADPTFKLGEVYAFPNPAKKQHPTLHIETGIADKVEIRIYDVSGDLRHQAVVEGIPPIINDGQGPQYAYEYVWDTKNAGSGTYIFMIEAFKAGKNNLKAARKMAIIK